ncbi:hypothetical protein GF360_00970 [candidate division WWE3 bacterium]|nr:hypothetical protein [candidate division WWE3 bacterium]
MTTNLTLKQEKFIEEYIKESGNGTQAAINAGYDVANRQVASQISYENLRKPELQQELLRQLEEAGLNPAHVFESLREAMYAGLGKNARNSDSLRAIELILKLYGALDNKNKVSYRNSYHLELQSKTDEELQKMLIQQQKKLDELITWEKEITSSNGGGIHPKLTK